MYFPINGARFSLTWAGIADELVMIGAHLDSWTGATGATDNAAGVAVMIEAVRILTAGGLKPRRTIRIALWGGHEGGAWGRRPTFGATSERQKHRPQCTARCPATSISITGQAESEGFTFRTRTR